MAVDTAAKRYSVANMRLPVIRRPLVIPDGTIAAADRAHFLNLYSGIALAEIRLPPQRPGRIRPSGPRMRVSAGRNRRG